MEKLITSSCQEENPDGTMCGQLAELRDRYYLDSTEGKVLQLVVQCINRHRYMVLIENYNGDLEDLFSLPEPFDIE